MSEETHRRNVGRPHSSPREGYGADGYSANSYRGSSSSRSHHGSQSISLKSIKNTSLNCAKSLTNKIISMSNTGIQAASSAFNTYKETAAANARKAALADPNSFLRIAERIANTGDPILSHRELVGVIEHMLTWTGPPAQLTLERDRYGHPTAESMCNIRLINEFMMEKVLIYIRGRRDCCVFVYKFTNWRMKTTYQPEEVIQCLELLQHCMESFGGFFLSLMTKSSMKRFKKLLRMTKISNSIAGGVKKQLTKLLVGSSNVHPGVPTDVRIHVIKAKVMYMIQLWHDVFLLEQGQYPVFFQGYRNLRESGIKFPQIDPMEHQKINLTPIVPKNRFAIAPGINLPLSPDEFDNILSTLQVLNSAPPGAQHALAVKRLADSKKKVVASINILVESRTQMSDPRQYEEIMRKMLLLNDCMGAHLTVGGDVAEANAKLMSFLEHEQKVEQQSENAQGSGYGARTCCYCGEHEDEEEAPASSNLVDLDSSSDSENEQFNTFFGKDNNTKRNDEDYDQFFADFGVFGGSTSAKLDSSHSERGGNYVNDLETLRFDNPVGVNTKTGGATSNTDAFGDDLFGAAINTKNTSLTGVIGTNNNDTDLTGVVDSTNNLTGIVDSTKMASNGSTSVIATVDSTNSLTGTVGESKWSNLDIDLGEDAATEEPKTGGATEDDPVTDNKDKKSLTELMNEFDNVELDFGHMSVTGF
ncbi:hypothetical protein BaOVIS_026000 [Babesia ovis]|uniref:VHS domain-containing protein n=1 Tax=Babesia ovis TaxID=5869 RepID=A0A9W5WVQ6_BABOV|nr:hypothetical protein BaOVIS_026000 [Babesia ovis]